MNMVDAVKSVFTNYVNFKGRARRSEYWWFVLANFIVSCVLGILANATGSGIISAISSIYSLAVLLPSLAVEVRRLHDIGKSGWWLLISLVPVVGAILLIVWAAKDGDPAPNQYGENPKNSASAY